METYLHINRDESISVTFLVLLKGNVSSFYPPDVNSGKNSGVFAGPLAEFFPL